MRAKVNLDALIKREDFNVSGPGEAPKKTSIQIRQLEATDFFYESLRKPDFQRDTEEWDPKTVAGLIRTFIEDDLIPAVILWQNKGLCYVIDGAHRLSALIAWVQNDYGDGARSKEFYNGVIPDEQQRYASRTRRLVEKEFGSYVKHLDSMKHPDLYGPDIVKRALNFGTLSLELQWVKGSVAKAESSFIRINQRAATITPNELELIERRTQPTVISSRAIIRRGTGHQYWAKMAPEKQESIKSIGENVFKLIFEPPMPNPLTTINLPAGGPVYSGTALRMTFDFVRLCVGTPSTEEDLIGDQAIEYLERTQKVMEFILSSEPGSVGLHPAVYFYSWTGKQQPILFLTIAELMLDLQQKQKLPKFISVRQKLEQYLIFNRALVAQVIRKFGTKTSGYVHVTEFYSKLIDHLLAGVATENLTEAIRAETLFKFLQPEESPYEAAPKQFSSAMKAGIVMRTLLLKELVCPICHGKIPPQCLNLDHIERREDGGMATVENAQITHPYCNTGIKEKQHSDGVKARAAATQKGGQTSPTPKPRRH
ncbi:MAG: DUF262 domain-containing protein [Chthoniobacteraceae bacterium]|jgi:hypothetical protein